MMEDRIEAMAKAQQEAGFLDGAAETGQSWNVICRIFDQIVETVGEERLSGRALRQIVEAGLAEMEIGIVPVNPDSVLVGTMQRTRVGRLKALLVLGANEGLLPLQKTDEGLLSEREKAVLEELDLEFSRTEDMVKQEERLAIYRTLSQPEERLYVSCSRIDETGESCGRLPCFGSWRISCKAVLSRMIRSSWEIWRTVKSRRSLFRRREPYPT